MDSTGCLGYQRKKTDIEVRDVEKMLAVAKGAATARCKAEQKLTGVMR